MIAEPRLTTMQQKCTQCQTACLTMTTLNTLLYMRIKLTDNIASLGLAYS